jgi:hypothetical protein
VTREERRVSSSHANVLDLHGLAARRIPPAVFDYGGSAEDEVTLAKTSVFEEITFRPRNPTARPFGRSPWSFGPRDPIRTATEDSPNWVRNDVE